MQPPGGHAIYIDAGSYLPQLPPEAFPGQALACALYEEGGIRSVEIGSLMFGGTAPTTGASRRPRLELLRLALPRRVYTQSHIDYVLETFETVVLEAKNLPGFRMTMEPPYLRHFTAHFEPIR